MRVTVCELRGESVDEDLRALCEHAAEARSDLVLLPEFGLASWFARDRTFEPAAWQAAVDGHAQRMAALPATAVLGTHPVDAAGRRFNHAFVLEGGERRDVHAKAYLPDEDGYWEASWYERGPGDFESASVAGIAVGFLVCTEMWFLEHARAYGRAGADVVAVPRCTPAGSFDRWLAGGRTCAVVSGAYCVSSNHGDEAYGGGGWIIDPDGEVLATTSRAEPFATLEIDLARAREAKATYPRYVAEL